MRAVWIGLVSALALFVALDRTLARRERGDRLRESPVVRLVQPERVSGRTIAALTIARAGADELLYARTKGLWRSREAFGAIADESAVQAVLRSFLDAQGSVRTRDPARAEAYGFAGPDAMTVLFHGPKLLEAQNGDVLFGFDVGARFDEGAFGRSFVREKGDAAILEIDRDVVRVLDEHSSPSLPPLLDTRIAAGCLVEGFAGFRQFQIEPRDGDGMVVAMEAPARSGSEPSWTVEQDGRRSPALLWRAGGYTALWVRGRYVGVASPARAGELGLDPPLARITLAPSTGDTFVVEIGALLPSGEAWIWNRKTNVVMKIERDMHAVIVPDAATFTDPERANPWEAWLRQN